MVLKIAEVQKQYITICIHTHMHAHTHTHTHTHTAMQHNTTHSTTHTYAHTHILKRKRHRHRIGVGFEPPAFLVCSIQKQHAVITSRKGDVEIEPASQGAKIKVNGMPLTGKINLNHKDRVLFGKFQFQLWFWYTLQGHNLEVSAT